MKHTFEERVMKTITNHRHMLAAIAAVCLTAGALAAHAGEAVYDAPARTVRYGDLNLNTQDGAARLYGRIHTAAEQVCGDVDDRQLARAAAAKACVNRAVRAGVRAVNNPVLTREYNAHVGIENAIEVAAR
jgi:UrcA family protein